MRENIFNRSNKPVILDGELIFGKATAARKQLFLDEYGRHGIRVKAALFAQVSVRTVKHWLHEDESFREQYEMARLLEAGRNQMAIRNRAAAGNLKAAMYLNSALNPEEFAPRTSAHNMHEYMPLAAEVPDAESWDEMPFIETTWEEHPVGTPDDP